MAKMAKMAAPKHQIIARMSAPPTRINRDRMPKPKPKPSPKKPTANTDENANNQAKMTYGQMVQDAFQHLPKRKGISMVGGIYIFFLLLNNNSCIFQPIFVIRTICFY